MDTPSSSHRASLQVRQTRVDQWMAALVRRHVEVLPPAQFRRALQAVSSRYVERRATLTDRSVLDSAGKRHAFAGYYGPMHFLTTRAVVDALNLGAPTLRTIMDLGCGTGVASAAWALACERPPRLLGIDRSGWAADQAQWTWQTLGLKGSVTRGDLVLGLERAVERRQVDGNTALVAGWTLNELDSTTRRRARQALFAAHAAGATVLIIEPIAKRAAPWWTEWAEACLGLGGRTDEWRFPNTLPAPLATVERHAGFDRSELTTRTLVLPARP